MDVHPVVSQGEWLEARKRLLLEEKELTRRRDELSRRRRELPWLRVDKPYTFASDAGEESLAQLFAGRSQLIVYHFMLGPDWTEGCKGCSFWADNFERNTVHLAARDATLIAVSRAPFSLIESFRRRMGWTFKWVSSLGSDFNFDYGVSFAPGSGGAVYNYAPSDATDERPGISVFLKDPAGSVFHTYSCYARGLEMMNAAYAYLDLLPKGRDEAGLPHPMTWLRHRDRYGESR